MSWVVAAAVVLVLAGAAYFANRAAGRVPRRHRQYGPGHIQQAIDHNGGRFGRWYHEDVIRREGVPQIGRNDPCPCGSGKKYTRCCGANVPIN